MESQAKGLKPGELLILDKGAGAGGDPANKNGLRDGRKDPERG